MEDNSKERRGKGALPYLAHICKFCNQEFLAKPLKRKRLYCGRSCQSKAVKRNNIKKTTICVVCNKKFKHYGERILCSRECTSRYLATLRIGENNPAFIKNKQKIQCENCSSEFENTRAGLHQGQIKRFCSLACSHGFFRGKSKDGGLLKFLNPYPVKFTKIKKYIKERDNFQCCFCGKTEGRLDVHHIDYDKHNNEEENLITLCFRCHMLTNFERTFWQIVFSSILSGSKLDRKGWGVESWITNNSDYCLKYLIFFKGKEFSFHKHKIKKELWHCLLGKFECVLQAGSSKKEYLIFKKGDKIELDPNTIHQLRALENSIIVEVSTQHFDSDSYRLIKGD